MPIEHELREFLQLVNLVDANDAGRVIAEGTPDEITRSPEVLEAWIGRQDAEHVA